MADDQQSSNEAPRAGTSPDSAGIALALSGASREEADAFLRRQGRLTELQVDDLQRDSRLHRWMLRFGNLSAVMKLAFEVALAFIFLAIAAGIGAAVWTAAHDSSLVIEAFSVPPDMAARGLTGQAVAAQLQDRLAVMQDATDSARPANSYVNNWGDDIRVQIPDTGISIGEFYRLLTGLLGHQTRITGEVFRTGTGIAIAARAGSSGGTTVTGAERDFPSLLQQAAEAVYARTQPYRYAVFVTQGAPNSASDKGVAVLKQLARRGDRQERAWALVGLGNWQWIVGDFTGALKTEIASATLDPSLVGNTDAAWGDMLLGHDEDALVWLARALKQNWRIEPAAAETLKATDRGYYDLYCGDFLAAETAFARAEVLPNYTGSASIAPAQRAESLALAHDLGAARAMLAGHGWKNDAAIKPLAANSFVDSPPYYVIDAATGDWAAAVNELKGVENTGSSGRPFVRRIWLVFDLPKLALATAMSGDIVRAESLIGRTPTDCYLCVRVRARIAAEKRDWPQAERWFAVAARQAPSLPFADSDWGEMLLHKGDYDGAIAKFHEANLKGPHFADPLEMWGEALMAKNRSDLALAKFEEANKYAPNWGRLHLKWGEALWYLDRPDDARAQFSAAKSLDLSRADGAVLAKWRAHV